MKRCGLIALGFIALPFLMSTPGCSGGSKTTFDPTGKHKMEEVAQMLALVKNENAKPPGGINDLERVEPMVPLSATDLRSGEIIYSWGAGLSSEGNASNTVIAYEKKTPTDGGWVLMQDGKAKQMTADEFKAAPKAK